MSVREDERQKNCPSRGLGIAAAAIGVGVGAALFYFFNKRSENSGETGSSEWESEEPPTLLSSEEDSYSTISVHTTTDTSIESEESTNTDSETSDESMTSVSEVSYDEEDLQFDSNSNIYGYIDSFEEDDLGSDVDLSMDGYVSAEDMPNASEWDVTASSDGIPMNGSRSPVADLFHVIANSTMKSFHRTTEQQKRARARDKAFRQRTWTVEECSICFETMLPAQELMSLPCTHRFHQSCILPWLQEQNTCPMCRKATE